MKKLTSLMRRNLRSPPLCLRETVRCHRSVTLSSRDHHVIRRDEAISPFPSCDQTKMRDCRAALASLSSRGTKRSRLFCPAIKQIREIATLRSPPCHREERSDLAFLSGQAKKRDCHAALAMTKLRVATPRGCLDKIQERLPRCARNDSGLSSRGTKRSRLFERASQ